MEAPVRTPVTIALINDYDIVVMGIAHILQQYRDRVVIAELDTNVAASDRVDIILYDCFAQPESDHDKISVLIRNPRARRVAVYTWNFHPDLIESARRQGVHGYLSKALPARDLVAALEAIHAGDILISDPPLRARGGGLNWPGRSEGLTDRESEILALITQGHGNAEVATFTHLSPNTVKSYIRAIYRKIDVTSRTQAVLWASTTASHPTTASNTGAEGPDRAGCGRGPGTRLLRMSSRYPRTITSANSRARVATVSW